MTLAIVKSEMYLQVAFFGAEATGMIMFLTSLYHPEVCFGVIQGSQKKALALGSIVGLLLPPSRFLFLSYPQAPASFSHPRALSCIRAGTEGS